MKMNVNQALKVLEESKISATKQVVNPCVTYKQIKPILGAVAFLIGLIPGWGPKAAAAVNKAIQILDQVCP